MSPCKDMHNLSKVSENYNQHLPRVSKVTLIDNFYFQKYCNMTKVTSQKFVKVTDNLLQFYANLDI